MNSGNRQLILDTLAGRPTARMPVAPFIHCNFLRELRGQTELDFVEQTVVVYEEFGFDLIHRNCTPAYDDLNLEGEGWSCQTKTVELAGRDRNIHYTIATPDGDLTQIIGIRWTCQWDCEYSPVEYLIKSERDFEILRRWQPPVGKIDVEPIIRARAATGERGIVAPWIQGAFNHVGYFYRDLNDLAMDPLVRPDFYEAMMDYFLRRNMAIARQLIEAGADLLSMGMNIASGKMFDLEFVRRHVAPSETKLIRYIQGLGGDVLAHNCGCARRLLPIYPELGMAVYESLTPPPHGDTVLEEAVEILGARTTLMGGVDQIDLLRQGAPAQIDEAVRGIVAAVRGRCRFILGTSDYFNEHTPLDNIRALAKSGKTHGDFSS